MIFVKHTKLPYWNDFSVAYIAMEKAIKKNTKRIPEWPSKQSPHTGMLKYGVSNESSGIWRQKTPNTLYSPKNVTTSRAKYI